MFTPGRKRRGIFVDHYLKKSSFPLFNKRTESIEIIIIVLISSQQMYGGKIFFVISIKYLL